MHGHDDCFRLNSYTLLQRNSRLVPDHASTAIAGYNLACVLALDGRRDNALALLRTAVEHGLPVNTALQMKEDSDLKLLFSDPRFDSLVASAKQRAALAAANK
jgi:predicted negative regulator of RcsB-dependent stress response